MPRYTSNGKYKVDGGKVYQDNGAGGWTELASIGMDKTDGMGAGRQWHVDRVVHHYLEHGEWPDHQDDVKDFGRGGNAFGNALDDAKMFFHENKTTFADEESSKEGVTLATGTEPTVDPETGEATKIDPKELAFNAYYNDLYNHEKEGTYGNQLKTELEGVYQRQANEAVGMVDAQYQSAAMQQAATVKQITDSIRNERMARLKAGMSESQIANQDMQMLMSNVNTMNQNAQMMSQARMEAEANQRGAKDQAYLAYLDQANARGQNAAAMYAADSGNAIWNTNQYMTATQGNDPNKWKDYNKGYKTTTGQNEPK